MAITSNATAIVFNDATVQTTAYVAATSPIPSGSVMLFYQAAAPTGWTQVTSLNDYDLRLVSGTGGGTGGTTAYSTVFTNQTPTISGSFTVGSTTLSTAEMPAHSHEIFRTNGYANHPGFSSSYTITGDQLATYSCSSAPRNNGTSNTGGGGSHTHSISGSPTSSAITLNVRYANIIICSKN
jgi:hypothetical protein